jgi:hypothetical protein
MFLPVCVHHSGSFVVSQCLCLCAILLVQYPGCGSRFRFLNQILLAQFVVRAWRHKVKPCTSSILFSRLSYPYLCIWNVLVRRLDLFIDASVLFSLYLDWLSMSSI